MKDLNKMTTVCVIWDIVISVWDMVLATHHFYKGRVAIGILFVFLAGLLVWISISVLKAKWDAYALTDWNDKFFAYLKGLPNENENTGITD